MVKYSFLRKVAFYAPIGVMQGIIAHRKYEAKWSNNYKRKFSSRKLKVILNFILFYFIFGLVMFLNESLEGGPVILLFFSGRECKKCRC